MSKKQKLELTLLELADTQAHPTSNGARNL